MKTLKILFAALIFVGFATTTFAQVQSDEQDVSVTANIIRSIEHLETTPLQFGVITLGGDKTIDIEGNISGTNAGFEEDVQVGRVHWDVGNNANITINFSGHDARLQGPDNNTLGVNYVAGFNTDDDAEDATDITDLGDGASTVTDGNDFYVWLAGTIDDDESAAEGEYTGDVQITLEYN